MRASLVAAAGALVALALWQAVPRPDRTSDRGTVTPPRAEVRIEEAGPGVTPPSGERSAPVRAIEKALDRHLETAALAERVGPADRAALRDALVAVRRAAVRARRRSRDPAWQAEQSRALVAADRLFRDKLGMGVADFLADAGPPGRVEDLGRRPAS